MVGLGIPALFVAILAIVALWRVGPAPLEPGKVGTTGNTGPETLSDAIVAAPLTALADILTTNAIGRQASLENVEIRQVVSERTSWVGSGNHEPAFVVLDPDVRRVGVPVFAPGERVTLIGLVRPAPEPAEAMRQWKIDEAAARALEERGTYLHVTEIRAEL